MKTLITEFLEKQYPDHQERRINWCKRVTGLDKSKFNGYSLEGNFIDLDEDEPIEPGVYFVMAFVRMRIDFCHFPMLSFEQWTENCISQGSDRIFHENYVGIAVVSSIQNSEIVLSKETSKHSSWAKKFWKLLEPLLQSQPNAEERAKFLQSQVSELQNKLQKIQQLLELAKVEEADKELAVWLQTAAVLSPKHKS